MPGCDDRRADLLDHLYGLLGADEAATLEAHVAGCDGCAAAAADARKARSLLAAAAKGHFPNVTFAPPADAPTTVADPSTAGTDARASVYRILTGWVVAAGLVLAFSGLLVPTVLDVAEFADLRPGVAREARQVADARQRYQEAADADALARQQAADRVAAARREHDQLVAAWVADETAAVAAAADRPFTVAVHGPAAAVPGAPNDYVVAVRDKEDRPRPAKLTAAVRAADGTDLFTRSFAPTADATLRLPAELWAKLPAGGDPVLHVTAQDPATGLTAQLREPVRLLGPVFTTFLTTDRPLYRPGETVLFRSTTLDRTRLLPPEADVRLRFELTGPDGREVAAVSGQARAAEVLPGNRSAEIVGPDGRPLRGVGCGGFDLKPDAPGGTYALSVWELPAGANRPPAGAVPLARRTLQVAGYRLDRFEKKLEFAGSSFGPGEAVPATLTVTDQGKPVAGAKLVATAKADDKALTVSGDAVTGPDGAAVVRFTVPPGSEPAQATLSVAVGRDGVTETVVRPVPLAGRRLVVEFFPEGGDLVAGLTNRVYVRATTAAGRPADLAGVLSDGERDVCPVRTLRDPDRPGANRGLGLFGFTPQTGKKYTLRLSEPTNIDAPPGGFELPPAKPAGVVLTARDAATKPGEPIRVTLGYAGPGEVRVLVGAYTRGRAVAHAPAVLRPAATTDVTLDPGPTPLGGVTRITVFEDSDGPGRTDLTPLAERLVFRRPKEALVLAATPDKTTYLPGEPVTLDVTARTEGGRPTPAVVYAAVVSRSNLAMADDKTERTLPTHVLLGGEVRHPDALEHADFLLTDQPRAAEALDLVLGTQGWRRFAEQAPEQFRTRVPAAEADRFLASAGLSAALLVRPEVQAVADRYWPQYEAAALALDRADAAERAPVSPAPVAQAAGVYEGTRATLGRSAAELERVDGRLTARRWWLVVTVPMLLGAAAATVWVGRRVAPAERRRLRLAAVGFGLVAVVLLVGSLLTADLGADWRLEAASAPKPQTGAVPAWQPPVVPAAPSPDDGNVTMLPPGGVKSGEPPPPPNLDLEPSVSRPVPADRPVVDDGTLAVAKPLAPLRPAPPAAGSPDRRVQDRLQSALNRKTDPAARPGVEAVRADQLARTGRPFVVRQYAHAHLPAGDGGRTDFAETLLWKPVLVLPDDGRTTLRFDLADSVTGYRVLVAGHTLDGRVGVVTRTIEVRPPLAVEPKLPREIGAADMLTVPLAVSNNTPAVLTARATVTADGFAVESAPGEFQVPGQAGGRSLVRLRPVSTGPATLTAAVAAGNWSDRTRRMVQVVPDGFPVGGDKSAPLVGKLSATVTLPGERVAGGTRVGVTLYPTALAGVLGGLDGLLAEPHGCFEQASSSNYPNVLALDLLRTGSSAVPVARARGLLGSGYRTLARYECADTPAGGRKGFEWFGAADRPHPALSAYGLMQFADMARVYPVDPAVIARTKAYLLSLRTGDGNFSHSTAALDRFGKAPDPLCDAYVVWAVSEAERGGEPSDLTKELGRLLDRAADAGKDDPYFVLLVANACLNRDRAADGRRLLDAVAARQAADGGVPGATTTITCSTGPDAVTETTALALLGWLKAERYPQPVGKAVNFLAGKRQAGGAFGATQATVLALKALVEHARHHTVAPEAGELRLLVDGKLVAKRTVRTDAGEPLTLDVPDADELILPGRAVELVAETTLTQAVPATLGWTARTRQPATTSDPPVTLAAGFDLQVLGEGQTTRLTATVTNTTPAATGMAVAVLGLPAGLTVPADGKQLRRLTEDGAVDFWEVRGRELVLYWRGLDPGQSRTLAVELVAEFPGEFRGPASRAYLYYDAGRKHWLPPLRVVVRPAGS